MNNEWLHGIATFLRRNKGPLNLDNYRPIAQHSMIYKIRECALGNRLTPLLNLLTDEEKAAYKTNRSTVDVVALIEYGAKRIIKKKFAIMGISKAFGGISKSIIRAILYGKGAPWRCVRALRKGHNGTKIRPKIVGRLGGILASTKAFPKEAHRSRNSPKFHLAKC